VRFVAVGAEPVGIIAVGAFARGGLAIGQGAVGIIAFGQLATGIFVVGQLSVGLATLGQLAMSPVYAIGQLSVGGWHGGGLVGWSLRPGRDDPVWYLMIKFVVFLGALALFWYAAIVPLDNIFSTDQPRKLR